MTRGNQDIARKLPGGVAVHALLIRKLPIEKERVGPVKNGLWP